MKIFTKKFCHDKEVLGEVKIVLDFEYAGCATVPLLTILLFLGNFCEGPQDSDLVQGLIKVLELDLVYLQSEYYSRLPSSCWIFGQTHSLVVVLDYLGADP